MEEQIDEAARLLVERLQRFLFTVDVRELIEHGVDGSRFAQAVNSARQAAGLSPGEARVIVMDVKRNRPPTEAGGRFQQ